MSFEQGPQFNIPENKPEQVKEPEQVKKIEKPTEGSFTETFGTEKEREENFQKMLEGLAEERKEQGISDEDFEKRLSQSEKFVEKLPLFHVTSLESVTKIFSSGKILSLNNLEQTRETKEYRSNTNIEDKKYGLDNFVFSSTSPRFCGDAALVIDRNVLDKKDCVVTGEDIVETAKRVKNKEPFSYVAYDPEVMDDYKKQTMGGKDFKEFLPRFIAAHHENPSDYIGYQMTDEYCAKENDFNEAHKSEDHPPLYQGSWYSPEIKNKDEIGTESVQSILVRIERFKDLLVEKGVPENLIKVVDYTDNQNLKEFIGA